MNRHGTEDTAAPQRPDALSRLRCELGATAEVWAGPAGATIREDRWSAISGARRVDYNLVVCHAGVPGSVAEGIEELAAAKVPGVLMLAGRALGQAQTLVGAGWVCIGSVPFMELLLAAPGAPSVCAERPPTHHAGVIFRCGAAELPEARAVIQEAFSLEPEHGLVALPPDAAQRAENAIWALRDSGGRVVCALIAVRRDDAVAIWSMATVPAARRAGYGAAVLGAALAEAARLGVKRCLLYASEAGEPLYRSLGFRELERWQLWSRPRWVLGRA